MLTNIYLLYASVGTVMEKYNTVWPKCLDQSGNLYSKEFMECYGMEVGGTWMTVLVAVIIDIWGAVELYKWALWKLEDPEDETAKKALEHPTCCAVLPLNNRLIGFFNAFITFTTILTIVEGFAVADGELIKAFAFPLVGVIIFNIITYVVLCSGKRNTRQGRMMVFWAWIAAVAVYTRFAYLLAAFIPTEWNLIYLYCKDMEHWQGMEVCYSDIGIDVMFDNILGIYFDVYFAVKLHRWASHGTDQGSKATVKPSA